MSTFSKNYTTILAKAKLVVQNRKKWGRFSPLPPTHHPFKPCMLVARLFVIPENIPFWNKYFCYLCKNK